MFSGKSLFLLKPDSACHARAAAHKPVPDPRGVTKTLLAQATFMIAETSPVDLGKRTASGRYSHMVASYPYVKRSSFEVLQRSGLTIERNFCNASCPNMARPFPLLN